MASDYVMITPARDEAEYLSHTIVSVAAQTVKPRLWVLVNDGSSDATPALMDAAARQHHWIRAVHRPNRGFRKSGGGVIEAFYDGCKELGGISWEFIVKLDGDLSFEPDYFEKCQAHFVAEPKLGIGGGTICEQVDGQLREEATGDPPFHVRGATKIYRRECWEGIGGLLAAPGWDTLDEVKANMMGWRTRSFPELKLHHHRYAGKADGAWKNWFKNGRANYISGYHPLFMFCKCLSRLREKPYGLVSLALWCGYASGYARRLPRVDDRELIRYFRGQQMRRLTLRRSLWNTRV
jgi:glycosyltransferase involved in cell wall biosynthesis